MVDLNRRQKIIDEKIKHDEDFRFHLQILTTRLLASWAADKIGFEGREKESYISQVVEADFEEPGFEDVLRKITKDFADAGIEVTRADLVTQLDICATHARNKTVL